MEVPHLGLRAATTEMRPQHSRRRKMPRQAACVRSEVQRAKQMTRKWGMLRRKRKTLVGSETDLRVFQTHTINFSWWLKTPKMSSLIQRTMWPSFIFLVVYWLIHEFTENHLKTNKGLGRELDFLRFLTRIILTTRYFHCRFCCFSHMN